MQRKRKIDSHDGDSETETDGRLQSRLSPGPVTTDPFREEERERRKNEDHRQGGVLNKTNHRWRTNR